MDSCLWIHGILCTELSLRKFPLSSIICLSSFPNKFQRRHLRLILYLLNVRQNRPKPSSVVIFYLLILILICAFWTTLYFYFVQSPGSRGATAPPEKKTSRGDPCSTPGLLVGDDPFFFGGGLVSTPVKNNCSLGSDYIFTVFVF